MLPNWETVVQVIWKVIFVSSSTVEDGQNGCAWSVKQKIMFRTKTVCVCVFGSSKVPGRDMKQGVIRTIGMNGT